MQAARAGASLFFPGKALLRCYRDDISYANLGVKQLLQQARLVSKIYKTALYSVHIQTKKSCIKL